MQPAGRARAGAAARTLRTVREIRAVFALLTFGLALCFSALLPFAILSLRNTVRSQRQSVILDLQRMFDLGDADRKQEQIVPSFEFVKYKYFAHPHGAGADGRAVSHETRTLAFVVCSIPLVLLVFAGSVFALSVVFVEVFRLDPGAWEKSWLGFRHLIERPLSAELKAALWVFVVAFFGGYLFTARGLLRAVNNFDLSPGSFISAALQLLFGVVLAVVIVVGGVSAGIGTTGSQIVAAASLVAAFLIGFIPEFGLRILYRASKFWLFKREDSDLYRSFEATPVEVIDGIDTEIRSRLAEFNIFSVQNLATANPIMLFVETPFGIYQSIDWVAQAQLFAAVGPRPVLRLWTLGIRTIFDLEKAVLVEGHTTPALRQAVARALLADTDEAMRKHIGPPEGPFDDATIKAFAENKVDDLHVRRLRQITMRIEARLGADSKRYRADLPAIPKAALPSPRPGPGPDDAANDGSAAAGPAPKANGSSRPGSNAGGAGAETGS